MWSRPNAVRQVFHRKRDSVASADRRERANLPYLAKIVIEIIIFTLALIKRIAIVCDKFPTYWPSSMSREHYQPRRWTVCRTRDFHIPNRALVACHNPFSRKRSRRRADPTLSHSFDCRLRCRCGVQRVSHFYEEKDKNHKKIFFTSQNTKLA